MDISSMSREEKKEVLLSLYRDEQELVKEVLNELSGQSNSVEDSQMSENEKSEIEGIIEKHFEMYDDVFRELA